MKTLVLDSRVVTQLLLSGGVDPDWFSTYPKLDAMGDTARVDVDGILYFLDMSQEPVGSSLLVIDQHQGSGFFDGASESQRAEAFLRLCRAADAAFKHGRESIPISWGPFNSGSRLSFYAGHNYSRDPLRIEVDRNPRQTEHVFAFYLGRKARPLESAPTNIDAFDAAIRNLPKAVALSATTPKEVHASGAIHSLAKLREADKSNLGLSTQQWIARLTDEQRKFIESPLDRSIRLTGAAGTGKTLSLILKCLVEFERHGSAANGFRCLFLTFSQTNVSHVLRAIESMDHDDVLHRWAKSAFQASTLQQIAYDGMRLQELDLVPISLDGIEGRDWQRILISEVLDAYRQSDWITRKARCSSPVIMGMESASDSPSARVFVDAVMNEFACVVEPQGVRRSADRREEYLKAKRQLWMMTLQGREDREVILDLYDRYRERLKVESTIGADQLTADYLVELGTNRWDNLRRRAGFDVVFVDELHLFNRQERMIPQLLMRSPSTPALVVMAYDFKQSVRVTYGSLSQTKQTQSALSQSMGLGETTRFELNKAFRYTPEIAAVLDWLDHTFPAVGIAEELGDEWRKIGVVSSKAAGAKPTIAIAKTSDDVYQSVFPRAFDRAKKLKSGAEVAVLSLSEALFSRFLKVGLHRDKFVPISDREQLTSMYRAGRKFIFSMPELVAGMQFDTVYLIGVNEGEVGDGDDFQGRYLQFVTQVYVGASRAENRLELYASQDRGGASRCLTTATQKGALHLLQIEDLASS